MAVDVGLRRRRIDVEPNGHSEILRFENRLPKCTQLD
jgi:hypothetical protein